MQINFDLSGYLLVAAMIASLQISGCNESQSKNQKTSSKKIYQSKSTTIDSDETKPSIGKGIEQASEDEEQADGANASILKRFDEQSLKAFLIAGAYRSWKNSGDKPFKAVSAHSSTAKVYFNDVLYSSLQSGDRRYPKGSIAVKDIYDASGEQLTARAIEVRVSDDEGPDGWVFFEGFVAQDNAGYYQAGQGFCSQCHGRQDEDFVVARPLDLR
jgi:outer membrane murein-binding lipoprotein Lpp